MAPSNSSEIDFNHPLFLHPSDTPGSILVSHQLVGTENYSLWSRSMRIALLAKNKLGFVDGHCRKDDYEKSLHAQWERCNAFVLSWILNTVSRELSAGIVFASTAAHVWQDLQERFAKGDGARVYFLHREISTLTQGDSSVSTYFSRLKLLWDEFNSLVPIVSCACEASRTNSSHLAQQSLFQFLMGLNETYAALRSQILLMKPLPTANQAYSMIIQEESQRLHLSGVSPVCDIIANQVNSTAMYSASSTDRRRFSGTCDYCKIKGHKCEDCYRLHGFPANFKFNKKRGPSAAMVVNSPSIDSASNSCVTVSAGSVPAFTTEQYQQLLGLLNSSSSDPATNLAGTLYWKDTGDW